MNSSHKGEPRATVTSVATSGSLRSSLFLTEPKIGRYRPRSAAELSFLMPKRMSVGNEMQIGANQITRRVFCGRGASFGRYSMGRALAPQKAIWQQTPVGSGEGPTAPDTEGPFFSRLARAAVAAEPAS